MKKTLNDSFYSIANIFKWFSIFLIIIPLVSFILTMIHIYSVQIPQYELTSQILSIVQLVGVIFWIVLNIIIFIIVGSAKQQIGVVSTRIWLPIALILALGPTVFLILLVYNVIPEFNGIYHLIMFLPLIEIAGFTITLVWSCMARSKLRK